jgi:hypothetical protein
MAKYVVETVQIVKRKYYCSVKNPEYIHDAIVFGELDPFCDEFLTEDIFSTRKVDKFPAAAMSENINAATYKWDEESRTWIEKVRWDITHED